MSSFRNIWARLADQCIVIHALMYENRDLARARKLLPELELLLQQVSDDDGAIVTAEAFALCYELRDELDLAISYRFREIELLERLYEDIRINDYDDDLKQTLLEGRGEEDLAARKAIIVDLERRCN